MNVVSESRMRLDRTLGYPVIDIMIPKSELTCWSGEEHDRLQVLNTARELGYSFVPVKPNQRIEGIVRTSSLQREYEVQPSLTLDWLVTSDTPILQLIELLAHDPERPFLVLQGNEIVGLVASADLNSVKSRASLYLLVAHFESELVRLIRRYIGTEAVDFQGLLSQERLDRFVEDQQQAKEREINLSLIHYLYLTDLTTIVSKSEHLRRVFDFQSRNDAENQLSFTPIRNPVSHQNSPVISSRTQVRELNESVNRLIQLSSKLSQDNHVS